MKTPAGVVALLVSVSSLGLAQDAAVHPRPGSWGAEVSFSGPSWMGGGSILRFQTHRTALVAGLDAQYVRVDGEDLVGGGPDATSVSVAARLGIRSYRVARSQLRPIVGVGLTGGTTQLSDLQHGWDAGIYGEIGIARFFGENLSVSAMSDLQVRRLESTRASGLETTEIRVQFDAVRLAAAVYF